MRIFLLFPLAFAMMIQCGRAGEVWTSYYETNRYDFTVSETELAKAPVWNETDDDPPLSARKALRLARAALSEFVSDSKAWKFDSLSLREGRDGHWVYLVSFELIPAGGGRVPTISIPVLMTGVAVKPRISPWPR